MSEMPPNAARSREIAAEQREAALPGPEERAAHMEAELVEGGVPSETAARLLDRRTSGIVVREPYVPKSPEDAPGVPVSVAQSWATELSLSAGVDYTATGRVDGALGEDSGSKLTAPIRMLQVGWLDSAGRVWGPGEITAAELGGASLTPLLVQVSRD